MSEPRPFPGLVPLALDWWSFKGATWWCGRPPVMPELATLRCDDLVHRAIHPDEPTPYDDLAEHESAIHVSPETWRKLPGGETHSHPQPSTLDKPAELGGER